MKKSRILLATVLALFAGDITAQNEGQLIDLLPDGVVLNVNSERKMGKQKNVVVVGTPLKGYKAFFAATDSDHGEELWVTDGTKAGTHMVKDIVPGTHGSNPSYLGRLNDKALFSAFTNENGQETWVSDGTEEGTFMLADTYLVGDGDPKGFMQINETQAVFSATSDESAEYDPDNGIQQWVWITDGTVEGTKFVKDIKVDNPGKENTNLNYPYVRVGRKVFFKGDLPDGNYGTELCVTDGTPNGTFLVKDINTEANTDHPGYTRDSAIDNLENYNNKKAVFKAWTMDYGNEPWASDGTEAGTYMIADTNPGKDNNGIGLSGDGFGPGWEVFKGRIWCRWYKDAIGTEFGGTNTEVGDEVFYDVNDIAPTANNSSYPDPGCVFQNNYFFCAAHGFDAAQPETNWGGELWTFDGVHAPKMQNNFCPGTQCDWVKELTVAGGSLYWYNEDNGNPSVYGNGLYRLDDKDATPVVCTHITSTGDAVHTLRNLGGQILYCSATTNRLYTLNYHKPGWDGKSDMGYLEPIFEGVTDPTDPAYVDPYQKALTGISTVHVAQPETSNTIYTIDGLQVKRKADNNNVTKGLTKGIYIVDGKKVVVK